MAISTYVELQAAAANWLARDDLTLRIPEFITLAEAKFNRVLFHPRMETRTTLTVNTLLTSPEFLDLPTDFQTMRMVRLPDEVGKPRLQFMSQTQMDDYRYSRDNVAGTPVYFTIVGDQIELAPTPNEDMDVEVLYRANIPALADNSVNWLLTMAPDLYLYGTLLEAAPYIQNDERLSVWGSAVALVIDQLNSLGDRQSFDSGPSTVSLPGVCP
jgi:hypothetical protein